MKNFIVVLAAPAIILSGCLVGCSNNTSPNKTVSQDVSQTSVNPRMIARANKAKRYFIMYSGVDTYRVTSAEVEKNKQQFTVRLAKVDSMHLAGLRNPAAATGNLTHMYMRDSTSYTLDEPHTIALTKVARIERR
jgi:hypothetical protein